MAVYFYPQVKSLLAVGVGGIRRLCMVGHTVGMRHIRSYMGRGLWPPRTHATGWWMFRLPASGSGSYMAFST